MPLTSHGAFNAAKRLNPLVPKRIGCIIWS